ncbi:MAG: o-succinylbenzoate synthase [Actinomycetota bacterium]|nr:o-succinylbenzoate synthase [Actinomycetota bacterium]
MEAAVFAIPMRTRFRGIDVREGMVLHGAAGWGEFSPFVEYPDPVARRWLAAAREAADDGWPAPVRDQVPVNVTVPAVGPAEAARIVRDSGGCRTAKVKVAERGRPLADDIERVAAVREAIGSTGRVRIDANGAWSVDEAVMAIGALQGFDLEYVEQPCRTLEEMALLRFRVDVPLAADESVRNATDPLRVAGLAAADIVVLKVQPLGGVRAALRVAEACALPVVVSSALETSVGIAAGVALAAALPDLPYACGLATVHLLTADLVGDPLLPVDGAIPVRRPQVDRVLLQTWQVPPERTTWWRARMARAAAIA